MVIYSTQESLQYIKKENYTAAIHGIIREIISIFGMTSVNITFSHIAWYSFLYIYVDSGCQLFNECKTNISEIIYLINIRYISYIIFKIH